MARNMTLTNIRNEMCVVARSKHLVTIYIPPQGSILLRVSNLLYYKGPAKLFFFNSSERAL